jgi:hypothetical protein
MKAAQKENASPTANRQGAKTTTMQADIKLCSGFGQYHSNERKAQNPKPYSGITMAEIIDRVKNPPSVVKDSNEWVIFSTLMSRSFAAQERDGEFWAQWTDFDVDPRAIPEIAAFWIEYAPGCSALFFSTASAKPDRQKSRMIVPLNKPLSGSQWILAQQCLNDALESAGFIPDRAAERPAQLCYLPNQGEFYEWQIIDGKPFDPMQHFAEQIAAKRLALDEENRAAEARQKAAEANRRAFVASGGTSAIDAFNACHSIDDVLIKAGYAKQGSHYLHPQSETGSYSASVKNGRVYALSANDPLHTTDGAHDAFSAWAILFFGGDQKAAAKVVYDQMRSAA